MFAAATAGGGRGNGGGGGGGARGDGGAGVINEEHGRAFTDARKRADRKKREFKQRLEIETGRRQMGAGEENYITLLQTDWDFRNSRYDYRQVAKMLKDIGIKKESVLGINRDPHRPGQTEVILKPQDEINMGDLTKDLEGKYPNFELHVFGFSMETIRVKGLPLTANQEYVKKKVSEAISPYVSEVVNVNVGKWRLFGENKDENTEAYMEEKLDGNYHVQVVPRPGWAVPQFLPVGPTRTQAQIEYVKGGYYFERQCNACFKTGHLRSDYDQCEGPTSWEEYAINLRVNSREALGEEEVPLNNEEKLQQKIQKMEEEKVAMESLASGSKERMELLEAEKRRIAEEKQRMEELKNEEYEQLQGRMNEWNKQEREAQEALKRKVEELEREEERLKSEMEKKKTEMEKMEIEIRGRGKETSKVDKKKKNLKEVEEMRKEMEKMEKIAEVSAQKLSLTVDFIIRSINEEHVGEDEDFVKMAKDIDPRLEQLVEKYKRGESVSSTLSEASRTHSTMSIFSDVADVASNQSLEDFEISDTFTFDQPPGAAAFEEEVKVGKPKRTRDGGGEKVSPDQKRVQRSSSVVEVIGDEVEREEVGDVAQAVGEQGDMGDGGWAIDESMDQTMENEEEPKEKRESRHCWRCGSSKNRGKWYANLKEEGKFMCKGCYDQAKDASNRRELDSLHLELSPTQESLFLPDGQVIETEQEEDPPDIVSRASSCSSLPSQNLLESYPFIKFPEEINEEEKTNKVGELRKKFNGEEK